MAHYMADGYDYMVDDHDVDLEDEYQNQGRGGVDSDSEDDSVAITRPVDTSAENARRERDIQGIPWDRLKFTREEYRKARLQKYKNYENIPQPRNELEEMCKHPDKGGNFYEFFYNAKNVKSAIGHFQLRNLVWATSKHDVYVRSTHSITHWSSISFKETEVLNFAGSIVPSESYPGTLRSGLSKVQIGTMAVKDNLLVAGGFQGELICKYLDRSDVSCCSSIACDDIAVTNAVEIYHSASGATQFMTSSNDCGVRIFDVERFALIKRFPFPWAVNHTSVSPDKKLLLVVGDDTEGFLSDSQTGKTVASLQGHLDYSFASSWHPDGRIFATGNQDMTCRLWDMRNLSSSFAILKGHLGAIRSIRFSSDGQFLAMAEPADFVHVYDTKQDYNRCQEIDFFGEIAGMSFSPDDEALFIGVADRTYGSLLEYRRREEAYVTQLQSHFVSQLATEGEFFYGDLVVDEGDDLRTQMTKLQQDRDAARDELAELQLAMYQLIEDEQQEMAKVQKERDTVRDELAELQLAVDLLIEDAQHEMAKVKKDRDAAKDQLSELQLAVDQLIEDAQQEASRAAYYRAQLRLHAPTVQVQSFSEYRRLKSGSVGASRGQLSVDPTEPVGLQGRPLMSQTEEEGDTVSSGSEQFEEQGNRGRGSSGSEDFEDAPAD